MIITRIAALKKDKSSKDKPPKTDKSTNLIISIQETDTLLSYGKIYSKFQIKLELETKDESEILRSKRYFSLNEIFNTIFTFTHLKVRQEERLELSLIIFHSLMEKQICFEISKESTFWEIAHAYLLDQLISKEMQANIDGILDQFIIKTQYWQNNALFLNKKLISSMHQNIERVSKTEDDDFRCSKLIHYLHQHCGQLCSPYIILLYSFTRKGSLYHALSIEMQAAVMHYLRQHSSTIANIQDAIVDSATLKDARYLLLRKVYFLNNYFDLNRFLQDVSCASMSTSEPLSIHPSTLDYNIVELLARGEPTDITPLRDASIYLIDSEIWQKELLYLLSLKTEATLRKTIILSKKSDINMMHIIPMDNVIIIEYSFIQEVLLHPAITTYLLTGKVVHLQNEYDIDKHETWSYWLKKLSIPFSERFLSGDSNKELILNQISASSHTPLPTAINLAWQHHLPKKIRDSAVYFLDAWSLELKEDLLPFLRYVLLSVHEINKDKATKPCMVLNIKKQKNLKYLQSVIFNEFDLVLSAQGETLLLNDSSLENNKPTLILYEEISPHAKNYLMYELTQKEVFLSSGEHWFSLIKHGKYPLLWTDSEIPSIQYLKENINYILHKLPRYCNLPLSMEAAASKILLTIATPDESSNSLNYDEIFSAFNQKIIKWVTPPREDDELDYYDDTDDLLNLCITQKASNTKHQATAFSSYETIALKKESENIAHGMLPSFLTPNDGGSAEAFPMECALRDDDHDLREKHQVKAQPVEKKGYYFGVKSRLIAVEFYDLDTYLKEIHKKYSSTLIFNPVFEDNTGKIVHMHFKNFILDFTRIITDGKVKYKLVDHYNTKIYTTIDICNISLTLMPHFTIGESVILLKELLSIFYQLNLPIYVSKTRNYSLVMSIILENIDELLLKESISDEYKNYLNYLSKSTGLPAGLLTVIEKLEVDKIKLIDRPELLNHLSIHPIIYRTYLSCIEKLPLSTGLYDSFINLAMRAESVRKIKAFESDASLALQMTSMVNLKPFIARSNLNSAKHVVISIIPEGHGDITFSRQFVNTLATVVAPSNISWICLFYSREKMLSIPSEMMHTISDEIACFSLEFSKHDYSFLNSTLLQRIIGATVWVGPTCLHLNAMQMNCLENLSGKVNQFIYYDPPKPYKYTFKSSYIKYKEIFKTGFSHAGVFLSETVALMDVRGDISSLPILTAIGMSIPSLYRQKSSLYSGYWAKECHTMHPSNFFSAKLFISICIHTEILLRSNKNIDILIPYPMSDKEIVELKTFIEDTTPGITEEYDFYFCNTIEEINPAHLSHTARKKLSIICYGVLSKTQMLILQQVSEPLTVATGDQSIIESLKKIPIYQVMDWKAETRDNLLNMSKHLGLNELFQWWQLTSNYTFKKKPNKLKSNADFYQPFIREISRFYVQNKTLLTIQLQTLFSFIKEKYNIDSTLSIWIRKKIEEMPDEKKSWHTLDMLEAREEHYETIRNPLIPISYEQSNRPKNLRLTSDASDDDDDTLETQEGSSALVKVDDAHCYIEYDDFSNTITCEKYNHLGVVNAQELFDVAIKQPHDYPKFNELLFSLLASRIPFVTGRSSSYFYTLAFFLSASVHESIKYQYEIDRINQLDFLVSKKYWLDAPQNLHQMCIDLSMFLKTQPIETWSNPNVIKKIEAIIKGKRHDPIFAAIFLSMYSTCFSYHRIFREQIKTWLIDHVVYNTQHQAMLCEKDIIHPAAFIDYPCTPYTAVKNTIFLIDEDAPQQVLDLCYETILRLLTPTNTHPLLLLWKSKSSTLSKSEFLSTLGNLQLQSLKPAVEIHTITSDWETITITPQINYLFIDANIYYFTENNPFLLSLKNTKMNITTCYLEAKREEEKITQSPQELVVPEHVLTSVVSSAAAQPSYNNMRNTINNVTDLLADDFIGTDDLEDAVEMAALPSPTESFLLYTPPFKICMGRHEHYYLLIKKLRDELVSVERVIDLDAVYEALLPHRDPELLQSALFYFNHHGYRMKSEKYSELLNTMILVGLVDAGTSGHHTKLFSSTLASNDSASILPSNPDEVNENEWYLAQHAQRITTPSDLDRQFKQNWIGYHSNNLRLAMHYLSLLQAKEGLGISSLDDQKWLIYQLALTQSEITPRHIDLFNTWIDMETIDQPDAILMAAYLKLSLKQYIRTSGVDDISMQGSACSSHILPHKEKIVILTVQYKTSHGDLQNAKKLIDNIVDVSKQSLPIYWIVFSNNPPHYLSEIEKKITKLYVYSSGAFTQLFRSECLNILNDAHLYHSATAHHFPKEVHLLLSRIVKETTVITEYDIFHEKSATKYITPRYIKAGLSGVGIYIEEPRINHKLMARLKAVPEKDDALFYAYFSPYAMKGTLIGHVSHFITTLAYCRMKGITNFTIYGNCNLKLDYYITSIKYHCGDLINSLDYMALKIHPKTHELESMQSEILFTGPGYFNISYINPFFDQVDASVCSSLVNIGGAFAGSTGDHSLFGLILDGKLPLYEAVPWKDTLLLSIIYLCEKLNIYTLRSFFIMQRLQVPANKSIGFNYDLHANAMQLASFLVTYENLLLSEISILAEHIRKNLDLSHAIKPKIRELLLSQKALDTTLSVDSESSGEGIAASQSLSPNPGKAVGLFCSADDDFDVETSPRARLQLMTQHSGQTFFAASDHSVKKDKRNRYTEEEEHPPVKARKTLEA